MTSLHVTRRTCTPGLTLLVFFFFFFFFFGGGGGGGGLGKLVDIFNGK